MLKLKRQTLLPILYITLIYLFFFLLKNPVIANKSIYNAITLCVAKVIPALFPFLVLNELMLNTGLTQAFGDTLGSLFAKLFRISKISSVCFISGCLFGFPLGTKSACSLYENKYITKQEAERLICFCSNTGPSFVMGFVAIILHSQAIGITIYVSQILSAVVIGLLLKRKQNALSESINTSTPFSFACIPNSITASVIPMLNICSFVCFFWVISSSIENILQYFKLNNYANIFVTGFLEITNGISKLENLGNNNITVFLCAFFIGWSGLSVILQSINIMTQYKIKCGKFIVCKLLQGVLCGILSVLVCNLLNMY